MLPSEPLKPAAALSKSTVLWLLSLPANAADAALTAAAVSGSYQELNPAARWLMDATGPALGAAIGKSLWLLVLVLMWSTAARMRPVLSRSRWLVPAVALAVGLAATAYNLSVLM
jgi:hypothetical protein